MTEITFKDGRAVPVTKPIRESPAAQAARDAIAKRKKTPRTDAPA